VGIDEEGQFILFGECKWSAQPVGLEVLDRLINKSGVLPGLGLRSREKRYVLFSRSGYTDEVIRYAQSQRGIVRVDGLGPLHL